MHSVAILSVRLSNQKILIRHYEDPFKGFNHTLDSSPKGASQRLLALTISCYDFNTESDQTSTPRLLFVPRLANSYPGFS